MRHRGAVGFVFVALLAASACGQSAPPAAQGSPSSSGTSASSSPVPTCDAEATAEIELSAKSVSFHVECLVVPAGVPITVVLHNKDHINHNFSIYTLDFDGTFTGDIAYPEETLTYDVGTLEAGAYLFQCDLHATDMDGDLIVA